MFDKQYYFYGIHATKVIELTADFHKGKGKCSFFNSNIEVLLTAPMVGFLYNQKAVVSKDKEGQQTSIFPETLMRESNRLEFLVRMLLLLDKDFESERSKRIDMAFRFFGTDNAEEEEKYFNLFNQYVLGGVEVLYRKLIEENRPSNTAEYLSNLYEFLYDVQHRFNSQVSEEDILALCKKSTQKRRKKS